MLGVPHQRTLLFHSFGLDRLVDCRYIGRGLFGMGRGFSEREVSSRGGLLSLGSGTVSFHIWSSGWFYVNLFFSRPVSFFIFWLFEAGCCVSQPPPVVVHPCPSPSHPSTPPKTNRFKRKPSYELTKQLNRLNIINGCCKTFCKHSWTAMLRPLRCHWELRNAPHFVLPTNRFSQTWGPRQKNQCLQWNGWCWFSYRAWSRKPDASNCQS